jgi:phage terminase large subunit-like protein
MHSSGKERKKNLGIIAIRYTNLKAMADVFFLRYLLSNGFIRQIKFDAF